MTFKQFYDGWNGNEFLTESWIELQSVEYLMNYLKTKKVGQKTKIAIETELRKRQSINNNKEKKSDKPDFGAIADYLENLDEKQTKHLEKLINYSYSDFKVFKEFTDEEVNFFQNIPGLPDRTNQEIYRGLVYKNAKNIKEGGVINYTHPERNYSSWSLRKHIAEEFAAGRVYKSGPPVGSVSAILKLKINKNIKYIDTFSILMTLKYEVNRKKINIDIDMDELIPEEEEILFVGGKVKSEVIYAKIN